MRLLLIVVILSMLMACGDSNRSLSTRDQRRSNTKAPDMPWIDTGPPPIRYEPADRNDRMRDHEYRHRSYDNYRKGMGR